MKKKKERRERDRWNRKKRKREREDAGYFFLERIHAVDRKKGD